MIIIFGHLGWRSSTIIRNLMNLVRLKILQMNGHLRISLRPSKQLIYTKLLTVKNIKICQNMKGREKMLETYLDNYCYNRPFDVLTQKRLRLESEAIVSIVKPIKSEF